MEKWEVPKCFAIGWGLVETDSRVSNPQPRLTKSFYEGEAGAVRMAFVHNRLQEFLYKGGGTRFNPVEVYYNLDMIMTTDRRLKRCRR